MQFKQYDDINNCISNYPLIKIDKDGNLVNTTRKSDIINYMLPSCVLLFIMVIIKNFM